MPADDRGGDLVLAQGTYAFVQNRSDTGEVTASVGPAFVTLSGNDTLVVMDHNGAFQPAGRENAIFQCTVADKGQYVILSNPSFKDDNKAELLLPGKGKGQKAPSLEFGHQVPVPGPISMALWPGQTVQVVDGCRLRLNDYVIVEVFDEAEARSYWSQAVLEVQQAETIGDDADSSGPGNEKSEEASGESVAQAFKSAAPTKSDVVTEAFDASQLVQGQRLVITGDRYRFFIPPRGVRVVPDEQGTHVRAAVTLELLEHCVLHNESGTKRYVVGPAVVYPRPTENFREVKVTTDKGSRVTRSFRGIPLTDISGVHVQALTDHIYLGQELNKGREYFFTGAETGVYMPNADQAIITYGERDGGGHRRKVHYAVDLPDEGIGRYVMDRVTGAVNKVIGPRMFLPNPVNEVIVQRSLSPFMVNLLYPGNQEAQIANAAIRERSGLPQAGDDQVSSARTAARTRSQPLATEDDEAVVRGRALGFTPDVDDMVAGDLIERPSSYTPPRSLVLDSSRYEGAVRIEIWPGYAILIVNSNGNRRVEVGPKVVLLEYGENVQVIELSTGTPKSAALPVNDVYLRIDNNTVTDEMVVETADFVNVRIRLSYQVDFVVQGDTPEEQAESRFRWFSVRNYVQFLADRIRSLVRRDVGRRTVQEFYQSATDILRDLILGQAEPGGKRPGRLFAENYMIILDLDILNVMIQDADVLTLLQRDQRAAVSQAVSLQQAQREHVIETQLQAALQATADVRQSARLHGIELEASLEEAQHQRTMDGIERETSQTLAEAEQKIRRQTLVDKAEQARQELLNAVAQAEISRSKAVSDERLRVAQQELVQSLEQLRAEVQGEVDRAGAIDDDLIAALKVFGDQEAVAHMAQAMSPLAILGGKSVLDVLQTLFGSIPGIEQLLGKLGDSFTTSSSDA